jgi:hypothetical protein
VEEYLLAAIDQGMGLLNEKLEKELEDLYWDNYSNSDILTLDDPQTSSKHSYSLPFYQRIEYS